MLLDVHHNRRRYGSIQAPERNKKALDNNVVARLRNTIEHETATCFSRMVATIKQSKRSHPSSGMGNLSRATSYETHHRDYTQTTKYCADFYKSKLERALNDGRFLSKNRFQLPATAAGCSQYQRATKPMKQQQETPLLPSVRCSNLSRSLSFQPRSKTDSSKLKLYHQTSTDYSNSANDKGTRSNLSNQTKNNVLRDNKTPESSWPFGINKLASIGSLLPILLAYLTLVALSGVSVTVDTASLPQNYGGVVHPIWLNEGLINLDRGVEDEPTSSSFPVDQLEGDSRQGQMDLVDILTGDRQQQPNAGFLRGESLGREKSKPTWSPFGREILEDASMSPSLSREQSAEQFWVQRRRLDRNRALEPPSWLREKPMRRGYDPKLLPGEEDSLETVAPGEGIRQDSNLNTGDPEIPGRKSRQSEESYDELLRYLIGETLQSQDFLSEIYDELEQRSKVNNQLSSLKAGNIGGDGSSQQQQQQLQQQQLQQKVSSHMGSKVGSVIDREDLDQDNDSNAALIVVGDEVSSGDGPATTSIQEPTAHDTHANIKAAYQAAQGLPDLDQLSSSSSRDDSILKLQQQQQQQLPNFAPVSASDQYGVPVRYENSPYVFETPAEAEPQALRYPTTLALSNQEPFHVPEEIDQIDDSQSMPPLQSQSDYNGNSAQLVESNEADWPLGRIVTNRDDSDDRLLQIKRAHPMLPIARDSSPSPYSGFRDTVTGRMLARQAALAAVAASAAASTSATTKQDSSMRGRQSPKVGAALRMIESGYLNKEQLVQVATKLKSHLEDMIGLAEGSILGLYPINPRQLLIKLDTSKLSTLQMMDMIQKYDFARGFIVISWPRGSPNNPMPILAAILNELAGNSATNELTTDRALMPARDDEGSLLEAADMSDDNQTGTAGSPNEEDQLLASIGTMDEEANSETKKPRIPLATLTALLGALYADQVRSSVEQLAIEVPPPSSQALLARAKDQHQPLMSNPHLIQLSAILLALVGAFVAVKLVMKGQDNRMLLRRNASRKSTRSLRSFWSFGGGDGSDSLDSEADQLGSANELVGNAQSSEGKVIDCSTYAEKCKASDSTTLDRRHVEAETGSDEHKKKNLEQLSRRLVSILSGFSHCRSNYHHDELEQTKSDSEKGKELSSSKSDSGVSEDDQQQQTTPYRSSRSYIKSLIDVLSKARPFSSAGATGEPDEDPESKLALIGDGGVDKSIVSTAEADHGQIGGCGSSVSSDDGQLDHGVLLSQMDITAAHLILSYMETHLEDKERLRREWLQLNGSTGDPNFNSNPSSRGKVASKVVSESIIPYKLARVALSEENRNKNRDPSIVAFDRNRVKLNSGLRRTTTTPSGGKLRQRNAQGSPPSMTLTPFGDYINASFIYDDDSSRPTHIIAQGPLEQTVGHFWQMIWEQGISVIVMLTRLNENSIRQCHCYWPTGSISGSSALCGGASSVQQSSPPGNISPSQSLDDGTAPTNGMQQHTAGLSNETTASARRGSVTSVFNMAAAGRAGQGGQKGQPIIGNKDLLSNVIYFDVCSLANSPSVSSSTLTAELAAATTNSAATAAATAASDEKTCSDSFDQEATWPKPSGTKGGSSSSKKQRHQQQEAARNKVPPSGDAIEMIRFEVHLVSEHVSSNDYLVRNMCLVNKATGETRTITQFHYLNWPNNGVPDNVKNFLHFRRKVHKSYRNLKSPILVHCSDGAGRSGTYTLIDIILERIRNGAKKIDPMAALVHLRQQRLGLCASLSQFEFVLMALAEEIQTILDALPQ